MPDLLARPTAAVPSAPPPEPDMGDAARARIGFDRQAVIMEADFSDLAFETPAEIERFYDGIEAMIEATGRRQWFFLVNYRNCRIPQNCWLAHSLRGKRLNVTHSLGTVRFDASPETTREIRMRADTEAFDANLFDNREAALARIEVLKREVPAWLLRTPRPSRIAADEIDARIVFHPEHETMAVDFSLLDFDGAPEVDAVYDRLEARLAETGRKWFFLVDYTGCRIDLRAWIPHSQRGKRLNAAWALGAVRYGASPDIEAEIRAQAARKDFAPNVFRTRLEAMARIAEMRRGVAGT